jgi:hypothetical protein
MLWEIIGSFSVNCQRWHRREVGIAQHALDDAEHQTKLEALMGVLCENWDAFTDIPLSATLSKPLPVKPAADPNEIAHPGV